MDWVATVVTVISSYLLSKKHRSGWVFSGMACFLWGSYAIWMVNSIPMVILNIIMLIVAFRGF